MIRFYALAGSAILALLVASAAGAQSARRGKATSSGTMLASAPDSTRSRVKAVPAASVTYARLRAAMGALNDGTGRFVRTRGMRAEHITLVDVRNLFRYTDDQKSYERALTEFDRSIVDMRSTLQSSLVLRDLLYDRQLKMSQVVGVDLTPDGRAIVFYQPE